jgi:hypothetical protein
VHLKYSKTKAEAEAVERDYNATNWLQRVKAAAAVRAAAAKAAADAAAAAEAEAKAARAAEEKAAADAAAAAEAEAKAARAAEEGSAISPTNFHTNLIRRTNRKPCYTKVANKRFNPPRQSVRPAQPRGYKRTLVLLTNANGNGSPEGNGNS